MSPTYGHVTELFQNRNSNTKEMNKRKNAYFQQNLAVFLAGTDSEFFFYKYYTEKNKTKMDKIVIIRTGTYL